MSDTDHQKVEEDLVPSSSATRSPGSSPPPTSRQRDHLKQEKVQADKNDLWASSSFAPQEGQLTDVLQDDNSLVPKNDETKSAGLPIATSRETSEMPPPQFPASASRKRTPQSTELLSSPVKPESPPKRSTSPVLSDFNERDDSETDGPDPEVAEDLGGPEEALTNFEWQDLELRYHRQVDELNSVQDGIMSEFEGLSNVRTPFLMARHLLMEAQFFARWADVGSKHEIDRSFKRQV